jgi:hypothetical protein
MSKKLAASLEVAASVGKPTQVYEWEQSVRLEFADGASVRVYFNHNEEIDEIHTVDCVIEHEKVLHKFRSVK